MGDLNGVAWRVWRVWRVGDCGCGCGCGVCCDDGVGWGGGLDDLDYAGDLYHGHVKSCDNAVYFLFALDFFLALDYAAGLRHGSALDSFSPLYYSPLYSSPLYSSPPPPS